MGQTWNYNGDPATSSLDAVRFLVGQTSTGDDVLLYDEEIAWLLAQQPTTYYAASAAARRIAARIRMTKPQSESYGQTSLTWGDRAKQFDDLAKQLASEAGLVSARPFVGGASKADVQTRQQNTDRPPDQFTVGQFDEPGLWPGSTSST